MVINGELVRIWRGQLWLIVCCPSITLIAWGKQQETWRKACNLAEILALHISHINVDYWFYTILFHFLKFILWLDCLVLLSLVLVGPFSSSSLLCAYAAVWQVYFLCSVRAEPDGLAAENCCYWTESNSYPYASLTAGQSCEALGARARWRDGCSLCRGECTIRHDRSVYYHAAKPLLGNT